MNKNNFTTAEKVNGELAIRGLSERAQAAYGAADPLDVYQYQDCRNCPADDECRDCTRDLYAMRGVIVADDLTRDELEDQLEALLAG